MTGIPSPPVWYSATQALFCFFGALLLFTLWRRGLSFNGARRDPGLFYLSMAVLVWALIGGGLVARACPVDWPLNQCMASVMASTVSNALLLLAMVYFEYGPIEFKIAQDDWKWHVNVLVASIGIALWVLFVQSAWPDYLLSLTTLTLFGISAYLTFKHHGFTATARVAIPLIVFVATTRYWESVASSTYPFAENSEWLWVLLLSGKAALIFLFLALGLSSRSGEAPTSHPEELRLEFLGKDEAQNTWLVTCTAPGLFLDKQVVITAVLHKILLYFAMERKRNEGWVKIKNKFYPADLYRICKKLEVPTLLLFENDNSGSYRLRVPPERILINKPKLKAYPELTSIIGEAD